MGALQPFPEGAVERLAALLKQTKTKSEYQRFQEVWLRAALGLRAPQIAQAIGWQAQSVRQLHSHYLRHGEGILTDKQAANLLGISEVTLQVHRGQVMRKVEAGSFADLVRMAEKLGIGLPDEAL